MEERKRHSSHSVPSSSNEKEKSKFVSPKLAHQGRSILHSLTLFFSTFLSLPQQRSVAEWNQGPIFSQKKKAFSQAYDTQTCYKSIIKLKEIK